MNDAPRIDWRTLTPAEREAAVSPSSCIGGDYRPFIEAYATRSTEAREEATALGGCWIEGRYGDAAAQRIELVLPPAFDGRAAGLLVFFHGGYWQELSAAQSLFAAAGCIRRGLAFAAVDYTLAPQARVGQIVGECRAAMAWLLANAAALGIDERRVVVAGSSAGAHLAAMVALEQHERLLGAVLVSGVYELEALLGTSVNEALDLDAGEARHLSPALLPLQGFPRALLAWGEVETALFKQQSQDFAAALEHAAAHCEGLEVPARNHFDVILDLADPSMALGRATFALFDRPPASSAFGVTER
jgi:arylformamidase